ncbi:DUF5592 family protein [Emergencia sp. 1XD21-10]|uniref:DUF5592 family protein n=1 Tax=Emergencia sp. 1XD21-10 TaxID=2304569 RepID=UPI001379F0DB|nr:DUF5592 family protein [Emergencia sp. 1XD21-10]NCE98114.1 hypothetical protein [Emergencia sp. 1XD21-10]
MKYLVTEEIESPNKVTKNIEVADFFFCVGYMGVCIVFSTFVHEKLKVLYYIFSAALCIFLTVKSNFNRKRRNYESIFLMLRHDINIYHALYEGEDDDEDEAEKEN